MIYGTSNSSVAVSLTGTKTFVVNEYNRSFSTGVRLRMTADADGVWMEGVCVNYDQNTRVLNVAVDAASAPSGTYNAWHINVAGEHGTAGAPGPPGPAGGPPGPEGPEGPQGEIGPPGPAGAPGPMGPQGQPGRAPGEKWFTGAGDPVSVAGAIDGDLYLDTTDGDVFELVSSAWVFRTNIAGPEGPEGSAGPQGEPGPQGPQGETGPSGAGGTASSITVTPAGGISSINVQAALQELDTEKVSKSGDVMTGSLTLPVGSAATPSANFTGATNYGIFYLPGAFNISIAGNARFSLTATDLTLTTRLRVADGTQALPGFSFYPETSSGLFRKGGGAISMSALDSEVMNWNATDKVTTAYGPIVLPVANPTDAAHASHKGYVDGQIGTVNTALNLKEDKANKGVANGYASLDASAKVPAIQLPSYVDDVQEFANLAAFPADGRGRHHLRRARHEQDLSLVRLGLCRNLAVARVDRRGA